MKKLRYLLMVVNGVPQGVKSPKTWIALGLLVLSLLWLWAGDSSARELSQTPLGAVSVAKNCDWDPRDYFQRSHPGQFGFFPVKGAPFTPGSYYVFVGPAGKDGRALPPRKIKTFGPKKLRGGHNYAALMADNGETLRWSEDSAQIMQYSKPPKNEAVVLARNEADPAEWYAICLMPAGGAAGPAPPPLQVTVTPAEHRMVPGEEVRTIAKVSGGSPPYTYRWFNNDVQSQVTKNSVRWTLRKKGAHTIRVVVTDSQGRTATAQSVIWVHVHEVPPPTPPPTSTPHHPTATPKPPVTPKPTATPPKSPVATPKPPQGGAWYREGLPKIEKNVAKDTGAYFGHAFTMSDGSASGKMSWKSVSPNCSGTYNGQVTWSIPSSMAGGSKVVVTATADTTHSNTCGYRNTGSGVHIGVTGLLRLDASCAGDAPANAPGRKVKGEFVAPQGSPGATMTILVNADAPGGAGTATYRYVWK